MTNEEAMLALGGAFLRSDLQVKVIHARSSESVYMNVTNGNGMPIVVRIANHRTPNKSFDFWIDTSHKLVRDHVNSVIRKVAYKFGREAFTIPALVEAAEPVNPQNVDDRPQNEDLTATYASGNAVNLFSLASWYLREDRPVFVDRVDEVVVDRFGKWFDKDAKTALAIVVLATAATFVLFTTGIF